MADALPIPLDTRDADLLHHWAGQIVVLDTPGPLVYIGTLARVSPAQIVLTDADVHDTNDSRSSKDLYLAETRDLGIRSNRAQVVIERRMIASASLLADVRS